MRVVRFEENYGWSYKGHPDYIPKDGAVIIGNVGENTGNGHIQTLCVEKGILCMYPFTRSSEDDIPYFKEGARVRIVSDGIEARIYQIDGEESPLENQEPDRYFGWPQKGRGERTRTSGLTLPKRTL